MLVGCGGERGGAGESAPPEPLIGDDHIAAAEAGPGEAGVMVDVELTAQGAERLGQATGENIGEPMVLRFDSEIIGAPIIRSEIRGPRATLVVPAASDDEAREIVNRVRARWPVQDSTAASN